MPAALAPRSWMLISFFFLMARNKANCLPAQHSMPPMNTDVGTMHVMTGYLCFAYYVALLAPDNSNKTLRSLQVRNNESLWLVHTGILTFLSTVCCSTNFSLLVPFVLLAQRNAMEECIAWLIGVTHCTISHRQFPETTSAYTSSVGVRWTVECAPQVLAKG